MISLIGLDSDSLVLISGLEKDYSRTMAKSDCWDCQHLNRAYLWCKRHYKGIEDPEEKACGDFVPLLWQLDYTKKLKDLN